MHRALNMYTLIGLGVEFAYLLSLAAVLMPGWFPQEFRARASSAKLAKKASGSEGVRKVEYDGDGLTVHDRGSVSQDNWRGATKDNLIQ